MLPLVLVSVVLFALRMYAATQVGFGDSEALYASWAVHPQPAYLDHPGLVGFVAKVLGEGSAPTPVRVHLVTAAVATSIPWFGFGIAKALGARERDAMIAGLVIALVPETAVGLFALTPDLLLAPLWLGALYFAAVGLTSRASDVRSAIAFLAAGLLTAVACAAKVSGLLLWIGLAATYLSAARGKDEHAASARSIWAWAGLAMTAVVLLPIVLFESRRGFPMIHHRLVATQAGAGFSPKNIAAVIGGQFVYLSPLMVILAFLVGRDLIRARRHDVVSRLFAVVFVTSLVPLTLLSLWSPVAEPHWIAPALLVLPLHAARRGRWAARPLVSRRMGGAALGVAGSFSLAAHLWVLVPSSARLMPEDTDPKLDIASELYGWPTASTAIREQMASVATPYDPEGRDTVVVGPHWTVCAQIQASLPHAQVGCATPMPDDFDDWLPRATWRRAHHVLFVTDNRFGGDGAGELPSHVRTGQSRVRILRGGRTARVFELYLYENQASGMRDGEGGAPVVREALGEARQEGDGAREVEPSPHRVGVAAAARGDHDAKPQRDDDAEDAHTPSEGPREEQSNGRDAERTHERDGPDPRESSAPADQRVARQ